MSEDSKKNIGTSGKDFGADLDALLEQIVPEGTTGDGISTSSQSLDGHVNAQMTALSHKAEQMSHSGKDIVSADYSQSIAVMEPVGVVHSALLHLEDCPPSATGAPQASIEIFPEYAQALEGLAVGSHIELITWLHLADRSMLRSRFKGKASNPLRGVFSLRSPHRPNPLGLHKPCITRIVQTGDRFMLELDQLEVLNGTLVLDIKASNPVEGIGLEQSLSEARTVLKDMCHAAYLSGLMPGFSGNASCRVGELCVITRSGAAKSSLEDDDFCAVNISDATVFSGQKPSSEFLMHLEVYRTQPQSRVILHTHPPCLTALGLKLPSLKMEQRFDMPVYEAEAFVERIATADAYAPGTTELAQSVGEAASKKQVVWLEQHGLCVWGESAKEVLALSEELEHLARVRLLGLA